MKTKNVNRMFIWGFLFLYALVALISFIHAADFFSVGNTIWMSYTLAFAFELGLAVCLAYILLSKNNNNTISWILMTMLVVVQVVGNTYSVFKYISLSNENYYQYLAKPLLFWIEEVSENTIQVIISWIMGAILPVVALLMTGMVSRTINSVDDLQDDEKCENDKDDIIENNINNDIVQQNDYPEKEANIKENDTIEKIDVEDNSFNDASIINTGKFPTVNVPEPPDDKNVVDNVTKYLGK